jgi:ACR3 family arsenite transporter
MHIAGWFLLKMGTLGPALLVISLVLGACFDPLASAARSVLPLSAFLLTLGSFVSADLAPPETGVGRTRLLTAIAWIGVGVPLLIAVPLYFLDLGTGLRSAILLSVIAPPVGSAAALATMLNLRPRLALIASISLTIAAPLVMPVLGALLHAGVALDVGKLIYRLTIIIGSAVIIAAILHKWRPWFQPMLPNAQAAAGVAVFGLVIVGLSTIQGARSQGGYDDHQFLVFVATAVTINLSIAATGALVFLPFGFKDSLTVGLIAGNRNVTLAWAVAGASLPAQGEAYIAACVIPVLSLPLLIKIMFAIRARFVRVSFSMPNMELPASLRRKARYRA